MARRKTTASIVIRNLGGRLHSAHDAQYSAAEDGTRREKNLQRHSWIMGSIVTAINLLVKTRIG
jgi:hypothetical protein